MPPFIPRASTGPEKLATFVTAYLDAAEWAGLSEEDSEALESAVSPTWAPTAVSRAIADCDSFRADVAWETLDLDDEQGGIDFYLTRNRHGAGFWDRGHPAELGRKLTNASYAYGEADAWFDPKSESLHFD